MIISRTSSSLPTSYLEGSDIIRILSRRSDSSYVIESRIVLDSYVRSVNQNTDISHLFCGILRLGYWSRFLVVTNNQEHLGKILSRRHGKPGMALLKYTKESLFPAALFASPVPLLESFLESQDLLDVLHTRYTNGYLFVRSVVDRPISSVVTGLLISPFISSRDFESVYPDVHMYLARDKKVHKLKINVADNKVVTYIPNDVLAAMKGTGISEHIENYPPRIFKSII